MTQKRRNPGTPARETSTTPIADRDHTITISIRNADSEPLLDVQCMALLFGVTTDELHALPIVNGALRVPAEWMRQGRRRTREAMAHTGSDFILDSMAYWAKRDHGAELKVVYK